MLLKDLVNLLGGVINPVLAAATPLPATQSFKHPKFAYAKPSQPLDESQLFRGELTRSQRFPTVPPCRGQLITAALKAQSQHSWNWPVGEHPW